MIEDLVVVSEWRKQGVGGKLVERVMEIAARANCAEISVSTETDNTRAISFYKGHGMTDESLFLERHFQ